MPELKKTCLLAFSGLLFFLPLAHADDQLSLPGLPVPQDAKVIDQSPAAEKERIYPLAPLRRISGQLRMDGITRHGEVSSLTYQLPPERKALDEFTAAREALQAEGAYLLFWCQARDCGDSSLWANEIFKNARLFGSDKDQAFLLLRKAPPQQDTLVALYSITRGKGTALLHAEQFVAAEPLGDLLPTPGTVLRELRDTGELDYPSLVGAPQPAWVELLARSLNLDSTLRASLAGAEAEAWRQALIASGVRESRLEAGKQDVKGLHIEWIR
ncbi:DUF4892 domain-containing protein [Pseudomonas sp. R5(2019)]|uniref:DUF4892 domain-containing protein n=1 Tax=Pseudomonas sp. R5(2019) TaxID=2697566 RepID=UPI0014134327|nr:DUF4892 domain-containing protein [Pseudomonas sp. R5(2019)]NBA97336.1 DUF4892 domain-containing protein [Pseudomonas sp. R5(2019)]